MVGRGFNPGIKALDGKGALAPEVCFSPGAPGLDFETGDSALHLQGAPGLDLEAWASSEQSTNRSLNIRNLSKNRWSRRTRS